MLQIVSVSIWLKDLITHFLVILLPNFIYNSTSMVRKQNSDDLPKPIRRRSHSLDHILLYNLLKKLMENEWTELFTCLMNSCEKSLIDFEYSSKESPMISFSGVKSSMN